MDFEFLYESLLTTARIAVIIIPLLFIFDLLNHRYGHRIESVLTKSRLFMPFLGAILGLLPGCNVAVIAAVFYAKGVVTLGTLLAVMIATSDEALYVFIPLGFNFIPILVAKLILAIIVGYLVDLFIKGKIMSGIKADTGEVDFCCSKHPHSDTPKKMFFHALKHGSRIILIVFIVLAVLNFVQDRVQIENFASAFGILGPIQPLVLGLIGLIPGCGTSVGIATLYAKGFITFGAVVAGLSTASGEAVIVLLGQGVEKKRIIRIITILFAFSVLYGMTLSLLGISY